MNNTIILLKAEAQLSANEFGKYSKGDKIWGIDSIPKEIQRWPIEQVGEAREELKKHRCRYDKGISTWSIEEYALEFCKCDEYGELVEGSEFELAEEK